MIYSYRYEYFKLNDSTRCHKRLLFVSPVKGTKLFPLLRHSFCIILGIKGVNIDKRNQKQKPERFDLQGKAFKFDDTARCTEQCLLLFPNVDKCIMSRI